MSNDLHTNLAFHFSGFVSSEGPRATLYRHGPVEQCVCDFDPGAPGAAEVSFEIPDEDTGYRGGPIWSAPAWLADAEGHAVRTTP